MVYFLFFFFVLLLFFSEEQFSLLNANRSDLKGKGRKVNAAIGNVNESIRSESSNGTVKAHSVRRTIPLLKVVVQLGRNRAFRSNEIGKSSDIDAFDLKPSIPTAVNIIPLPSPVLFTTSLQFSVLVVVSLGKSSSRRNHGNHGNHGNSG